MSKIVSAFPGTGKSHLTQTVESQEIVLDSDSSSFSWLGEGPDKIRHPDFPQNYMTHIQHNLGAAGLILVSTHEDVRNALVEAKLPFTLVYPERGLKNEYLERFSKRGSPEGFINLMDKKWDEFVGQLEGQKDADHIVLTQGQFLSDVVRLGQQS